MAVNAKGISSATIGPSRTHLIFGLCGNCHSTKSIKAIADLPGINAIEIEVVDIATNNLSACIGNYIGEGIVVPAKPAPISIHQGPTVSGRGALDSYNVYNKDTDSKLVDLVKRLLVCFHDRPTVPDGMAVSIDVDIQILRQLKEEVSK